MVKYKCKRSKVIYILLEERRNTMTETGGNAAIATTEENRFKKLDYSLKTAEERKAHVEAMVAEMSKDQLKNKKYIEILSDYIVSAMTPEEKKSKMILTDNRMVTVNKRETSYQGLVSKFENGEDGLWNLIIDDKNVLLTHKVSITEKDVEEIKPLQDLKESIAAVEKMVQKATGKKKFLLKKQLIEMHQEQYTIKGMFKQQMITHNIIKSITKTDLSENITINEDGEPVSDGLITFFNHEHISALLCNYSALKEDAWGKFSSDSYYMMEDLDNLIEKTLRDNYPLYYKLLIYKIDGKQNAEIQQLLDDEFGIIYSVEYLSSLWRNKIPKLLAEQAKEDYLIWHFTYVEKGKWKKCSRCGEVKLANNKFFSKNNTSKDGFYSICKKCRNKKKEV